MKQTIALKLKTTPEHFDARLETMEAFNASCNRVAEVAFEQRSANNIALQPFVALNACLLPLQAQRQQRAQQGQTFRSEIR